jgi:Protein of unknown function (DUF1573)
MKQFVALLILGMAYISICAQEKGSEIEFDYTIIDYGTIEKKSDGERVFKFKNTGNEPLIIFEVKTTIGCTITYKPTAPILPGETGELKVKYDTGRVNPIRKTITVLSNANTPIVALKIKGQVVDHGNHANSY